jgi:hypothetical protein
MKIEVHAHEIKDAKADNRGRINLGTEYADEEVVVAVLADGDGDEGEDDG